MTSSTVAPPFEPAGEPSRRGWIAAVAIAAGVAALALWLFRRRRKAAGNSADEAEADAVNMIAPPPAVPIRPAAPPAPPPVPSAPPVPPVPPGPPAQPTLAASPARPAPAMLTPAPPPAPADRAWLDLTIEPLRAGVNLVTATADIAVTVRNTGSTGAGAVRVEIQLLSARAGQDEELGALFAAPIARPASHPFDLEPGAERRVRTVATLSRDALNVLLAGERPMFVPVVAVKIVYGIGGGATGQTAAAFIVGVERAGAAKLMPIWLDRPSRMYDTLGQRPHGLTIRS